MEDLLKTAVLILLCAVEIMGGCRNDLEYFKNEELLKYVDSIAENEPTLASTYTIGFSSRGTELRVLRITAAPEDALIPQVKLIGGIHGDEPPSTHVLIELAKYLIESYHDGEIYITWLLNNTRIHILPRLNPDGFSEALEGECTLGPGRRNGNRVDLNRAFPPGNLDDGVLLPQFQPEVEAVMRWSEEERFVIGAGLHTGALVAVYPLDAPLGALDMEDYIDKLNLEEVLNATEFEPTTPDERDGQKAQTRDDDIFVHLASTYARNHMSMVDGFGCDGRDRFPGGIVNGAEWYRASGSMMDYNYLFAGTLELTLEVYCCKYPAPRLLCHIWEQNKMPLLKLCAESIRGLRGVVTSSGIPLELAAVTVLGRDLVTTTNSKGQYFRVLLPGRYLIQVEMNGMKTQILEVHIDDQPTAFLTWTELNVDLQPDVPPEISTLAAAVSTVRPEDHEATPVTVSATLGSNLSSSEQSATLIYDQGGLDPTLPPDDNSDVIGFFENETSLLETKSSRAPEMKKLSFLLSFFYSIYMIIT